MIGRMRFDIADSIAPEYVQSQGVLRVGPIRICMAPMHSIVGDIEGNLCRMLGICDAAQEAGADLVCFPELSICGYSMPSSVDYAMESNDSAIRSIVDRSDSGLTICFGFMGSDRCITQALAEDGEIIGLYRKSHLGSREAGAVTPGDHLPVFRSKHGMIGISICWEAHFPEIVGSYAVKGADMILMPFASGLGGDRRQSVWDRILPARAYDNTVFIAACNEYGDNGCGTFFGGGAAAYDVKGMLLGRTTEDDPLFVDLDPSAMDRIRGGRGTTMSDLYFLERRRPELYSSIMKKIERD